MGVSVEELAAMILADVDVTKALRGGLAEHQLATQLAREDGVLAVLRPDGHGQPDRAVELSDGTLARVECKVVDAAAYADGTPKLDLRRSSPREDGRLYRADQFEIVAACLHSLTGTWEFRYKATALLARRGVDISQGDADGAVQGTAAEGREDYLDPNCRVDMTWRTSITAALGDVKLPSGAWEPSVGSGWQLQLDGVAEPTGWHIETHT